MINLIEPRVRIHDKPTKIYHDDYGRKWIAAKPGEKYALEVKNNTLDKILTIISVDGLNVITGKKAEVKPKDGYIVEGYSNIIVSGWRISMDEVREFQFTEKGDSYAKKLTGDDSNVGVIGFAFYKIVYPQWIYWWSTAGPYPVYYQYPDLDNGTHMDPWPNWKWQGYNGTSTPINLNMDQGTTVAYSASVSFQSIDNNEFKVGTEMGEVKQEGASSAAVENTSFMHIDIIYYDTYENLVKKGIIRKKQGLPQPFANTGFCPEID